MITVIILTKNNAGTIEKTLKSISWAGERIIIDDDSCDATVDIAKKRKATVYQHPLNDDFASQRNFGLSKAKGEWVLFIDSDEEVSEELEKEILYKITNHNDQITNKIQGYYVKRKDIFLGKELQHGETAHVTLLRLARKEAGTWVRPVHEYWDVKGKTEMLDHPVLHHSHTSIRQFVADINRYSTINAQYFYKQGITANAFTIIFYPLAKFIQNYFFRFGFLDGTAGAVMAIMMSFHSFLTRGKLYILQNH